MWSQEQTGQHYNIKSPESVSYICEARNPVSEKTQTYNSNDCLATGNPEIYIYTGIGAGVLLLVAVVVAVVVWLIKKHSKDLRSTGNASHPEEDREKAVAISQAEIVEEEKKLLLDEELTQNTSVKDRVNQINQNSEAVKTGDGEGEKKPLLDKAGSTDSDVIVSNIPFKLNNQNQVWGGESGKKRREEKEQNAESKQNMNFTLGSVPGDTGQTAPPKPPRSSLNYNSPYPQILETQHSREHHGRGPDQSMSDNGTERDGEGDVQLMSQKTLDTGEESRGKETWTREEGEHVEKEKVVEDDLVRVEGEGQEETDRRGDGGEKKGQEREMENNEEEQMKGEGEERGKKGEKGEEGKSPTSPEQPLPCKATRPPLAPKP
ncbi:high mobility group nucleosome-binding domain-containing protein 5-like isoform X2 [Salvelinus alpinus]|uniref:high mobility group nucleosome-binding domain-containing protein 5-like isoform X2 n=1 Tax=Salvelinus alpinus TaxID=8036 RepID=UPI0039FD2E21